MLEFYYKFHRKSFKKKSHKLAEEIESILVGENQSIQDTDELNINEEYRSVLGHELFTRLNNLYFTLRSGIGKSHFLLKRYLPEEKHKPQSNLLFADFFSGAGGLGRGISNCGFSPTFVNDTYTDALETYYFNHTLHLDYFCNSDIKDVVANINYFLPILKDVKLIVGGPPCQGFSTANRWNFTKDPETKIKRFIEDERNVLYKDFVAVLGKIKPDFFLMENVRGMMKVEKQIEEDIKTATHQEYYFIPLVLDAQRFNIPQSRTRYFLIGGKDFVFIEQIKKNILSKKNGYSHYKLGDALFHLPALETNPFKLKVDYESDYNGRTIRKFPTAHNSYLSEINKGFSSNYVFNHKARYNNENDLEIFRRLPPGANSLHESISHLNKYSNRNHIFKDKYFKLKRDEVSKTMTSHMKYDCHMYIHPEEPRGLSPREAARIQTFPDDYVFRGSLNGWYKQIGNAVPVKLSEIIANEIIRFYE